MSIPLKNFYGSTKKEYLHLLEKKRKRLKQEKEFKERPLPAIKFYDTCFSERKVWKHFHRQKEALECCRNVSEKAVCLFAVEKLDGKRRYLVTTRKQFWEKYQSLKQTRRYFYEVIPENTPCRLYFDIEFKHQFNQSLNGDVVIKTFIAYVCHCIYQEFKISCNDSNIINLTSSTEQKFSRHLIFHHPDLLFCDNIQCGEFVKEICFSLRSFLMTGLHNKYLPLDNKENQVPEISTNDLNDIMIYNEKNEKMFLCDLCVYTKNRNFRLYKSSKVSKNVPLLISKDNQFKFKSKPEGREKYLKYQMRNEKFDAEFEMFSDTLVCPSEFNIDKVLTYGSTCKKLSPVVINPKEKPCEVKSGTKSLFPELDKFILDIVDRNEPKGNVRRWIHHKKREMVIYDIGDNRWCGNIQRQHKSNHIYYVADLRLSQVYQKCHDFECSNYRSKGTPIPPEINPLYNVDDTIEEFDDSVINESLIAMFDEDIDVVGKENLLQHQSKDNQCEYQNLSDYFDDGDEIVDNELLTTNLTENHPKITIPRNPVETGEHSFDIFNPDEDEIFLDKSLLLADRGNLNSNSRNNSFDLFDDLAINNNPDTCQQSAENGVIENDCTVSETPKKHLHHNFNNYDGAEPQPKKPKNEQSCNSSTSFTLSQESRLNDFFNDDFVIYGL